MVRVGQQHPKNGIAYMYMQVRFTLVPRTPLGILETACVAKPAKFVTCSAFVGTISTPVHHAQKSSGVEIVVGKELGSILLRHQINNIYIYPDLASTRFRIHSVFRLRVDWALMTERVSYISVGAFPPMLWVADLQMLYYNQIYFLYIRRMHLLIR